MKNWSLKHRIIVMGLLPGLIVAVALGGYFGLQRFHDLNDLLDQRALAMAKQLAPVCEYGVTIGNIGILQNIATDMLEERDVRSVTIYNQDMDKLAHAGPKMMEDYLSGTEFNHNKLHLMHTSGSVRVKTPIYQQNIVIEDELSDQFFAEVDTTGRLLGFAELELSNANTRLERYQDMVFSSGVVLFALLACVIISLWISHQFTRPLSELMSKLDMLKAGKYETRIRVDDTGELSDISGKVNKMTSKFQEILEETQSGLEQRMTDLQDNVDELEIRNHQLSMGKNEAIEASQTKSAFLANASHELRTPLSGIYNYLTILERSKLTQAQAAHVVTLKKQYENLKRIIDDLLDLSKIEAEQMLPEHIPFHLRDTIEEAIIAAAPGAFKKDLRLYYTLSDEIPLSLVGDPFRIQQVLGNLLSNAIKFTSDGQITVTVALGNQRDNQVAIHFSIVDTGQGISEEQQKRLFKPFGQGDSSTARRFGGSGLGLMISKALVEKMNGEIKVKSQVGEGACFQFHIMADLHSTPQRDLSEPDFPQLSLALLNAPPSIVSNLKQRFTEWQIPLHEFNTLTELETALEDNPAGFKAVLAWSHFANLNERATTLQAQLLATYELPLLAVTDSMQPAHTQRLIGLGARDCLSLPITSANLYQFLQRHFGSGGGHSAFIQSREHLKQHSNKPNILVVDDNEPNLLAVAMFLEDIGLHPLKASSGQEAIDIVRNQPVSLVFMDIQMPNMNGLQAFKAIRQLPGKASLPIIALTAHAMDDERRELLREGMNDYQTKPISPEQLAACVQRWTGYQYLPTQTRAEQLQLTATASTTAVAPADTHQAQKHSHETANMAIFSATDALEVAGNNVNLATDMMDMLTHALEQHLGEIRDAWEMEQMDELLLQVHKLHGATRYCGTPALRHSLKQFESDLRQSHSQYYPEHMRTLFNEAIKLQNWTTDHDWKALLTAEQKSGQHRKREDQASVVTEA